jgi:hypothetical protein
MRSIFYDVQTEFLNTAYINFMLRSGNSKLNYVFKLRFEHV